MSTQAHHPPRLAVWLLDRLRPGPDGYAVLGDFEEEYHYLSNHHGARYASRWYWTQVLLSVPGFITQLAYWSLTMFRNYLTIASRQLIKNGRYTAINIAGLSVALACCVVAYLNYDFSYGFDKFHENADGIYRVFSTRVLDDQPQEWGISPMPLGPALKAEFPFVEESVRYAVRDAVVQYNDLSITERISFADPAVLDVFTFPLTQGSRAVLQDPGQLVISPQLAEKYFGETNPVGEQLTLWFEDEMRVFAVGGVIEETPTNSSIQFDILTSYENMRIFGADMDDWGRWGVVTFLQSGDAAAMAGISDQLEPILALQNSARPDWEISKFSFVPLTEMSLASRETRAYYLAEILSPEAIVGPAVIALLLLLMACFNFMNTAIAFATNRLKEIGVRKVMGGFRQQLIGQFMGESMLLCAIAFVLALLLAEVFAPAYSSLWPNLDLPIVYADNLPLLLFLGGLLLATGLFAGAYPAFYISGFSPVNILKGRHRLAGLTRFTRTLLTLQLAIAVMVIFSSIVFTNNAAYQETLDLGYDEDMVLVVPLGQADRFSAFRDALAQNPDIVSVAGSESHLSYRWSDGAVETLPTEQRAAQKGEADVYTIGDGYLETMGLSLVDGRGFDPNRETDYSVGVLVNQTFLSTFGMEDPVGETIVLDSTRFQVVGVVADFLDAGVWNPIDPAIFRLTRPDQYRYLTARVGHDKLTEADAFLRETWQRLVPEQPYVGGYQDDVLTEAIMINRAIKTTFYYIAGLAILIAAAGLYGLMSLAIARRTKEIGIRKVLGASVASVGRLVNREFVIMLLVASMVASIGGHYLSKLLLDAIWAYHSGVGFMPAILSTAFIFVIALATVGLQVYRVATDNPVDALRYE